MDKTKTTTILCIVAIIGIGAIIYLLVKKNKKEDKAAVNEPAPASEEQPTNE